MLVSSLCSVEGRVPVSDVTKNVVRAPRAPVWVSVGEGWDADWRTGKGPG